MHVRTPYMDGSVSRGSLSPTSTLTKKNSHDNPLELLIERFVL